MWDDTDEFRAGPMLVLMQGVRNRLFLQQTLLLLPKLSSLFLLLLPLLLHRKKTSCLPLGV